MILNIAICARKDLNPQPPDPKSGALSIELRAHYSTQAYIVFIYSLGNARINYDENSGNYFRY